MPRPARYALPSRHGPSACVEAQARFVEASTGGQVRHRLARILGRVVDHHSSKVRERPPDPRGTRMVTASRWFRSVNAFAAASLTIRNFPIFFIHVVPRFFAARIA